MQSFLSHKFNFETYFNKNMTIQSMTVTEARAATKKRCGGPYKLRTKIIIGGLVILVFISAISGYLIGSAEYNARRNYEPPDPIEPLKPSASRLHVFQKAAWQPQPAYSHIEPAINKQRSFIKPGRNDVVDVASTNHISRTVSTRMRSVTCSITLFKRRAHPPIEHSVEQLH
ncbi:hypothetical protein K1T71_007699 [Dendrolimus kikuchii]|uniref:Uncharacterized protein n=1 Tax=Dendrolimus kikuchii TaxID=765133 RepID=A0ACC1CY05_9NEOP|nr:hypothetical protein K1T71_007699 [Dendrolimus kikuchii]